MYYILTTETFSFPKRKKSKLKPSKSLPTWLVVEKPIAGDRDRHETIFYHQCWLPATPSLSPAGNETQSTQRVTNVHYRDGRLAAEVSWGAGNIVYGLDGNFGFSPWSSTFLFHFFPPFIKIEKVEVKGRERCNHYCLEKTAHLIW